MTPDRWERINAVFSGACGLDSPRRASFLNDTCAGDDSLGREIEELLECDARCERERFLDVPLVGHLLLATIQTGRRVRPYELGERIGGGGMGEVYRATRIDDYRQEVAIKFIWPGRELANAVGRCGRDREAEELIRQALLTIELLARDFPSEPLYRDALSHQHANVAQALARRREFDEAIRHHEAGLAIAEPRAGQSSSRIGWPR